MMEEGGAMSIDAWIQIFNSELIFRSQTAYCLGHKNDSEEIFVMSQDVDSRGLKPSTPNSADLSLMSSLTKSNEVMLW